MAVANNAANVFWGADALQSYCDPQNHRTSLIELHQLSQVLPSRPRIFAKMAPGGNIKRIPAWYMFNKALQEGRLENAHTLAEASSGGFVSSLAMPAHQHGKDVLAIIANDTAQGRKWELGLSGVKILLENDIPVIGGHKKPLSPIEHAKWLGQQKGFLNLGQYDSADNAMAYQKILGPQIIYELNALGLWGAPLIFCAGVGTGGTILGCGRALKAIHPDCQVIAGILNDGERVPGVRDPKRLTEVKTGWQEIISPDRVFKITRYQAYLRSLELIKLGNDGGPSSGLALAALLEYAKRCWLKPDTVIVFICPDLYTLYLDKYETILDGSEFARKVPFDLNL